MTSLDAVRAGWDEAARQDAMFHEHDLVTYDPQDHDTYPDREIRACDFAIVCVGTPEGPDGRANLDYVWTAAVDQLPKTVPVALRSTVPPGTTDLLFGGQKIRHYVHIPEFMPGACSVSSPTKGHRLSHQAGCRQRTVSPSPPVPLRGGITPTRKGKPAWLSRCSRTATLP